MLIDILIIVDFLSNKATSSHTFTCTSFINFLIINSQSRTRGSVMPSGLGVAFCMSLKMKVSLGVTTVNSPFKLCFYLYTNLNELPGFLRSISDLAVC